MLIIQRKECMVTMFMYHIYAVFKAFHLIYFRGFNEKAFHSNLKLSNFFCSLKWKGYLLLNLLTWRASKSFHLRVQILKILNKTVTTILLTSM